MRSFTAVVALSALTMVAAQNATEFTINVNEIDTATRNAWCIAQSNTCGELCDNNPVGNSCDQATLDYYCTCQNGSAPGLQYYTQTVDTFVCQQAFSDCIDLNENNQQGQSNCTTSIEDHCGTLDPSKLSSGSSSSSSAASGTASATGSATSGASTAAASSTSAAGAAPTHIQYIGTGAAAAAFGMLAYVL